MVQLITEIAQGIIDRKDPQNYIRPRVRKAVGLLDPVTTLYSPGGFIHVEIGFDDLGRLVRAHLWKTEGAPALDNAPHNHRNRVDSMVWYGLFQNTEYSLVEGGDHQMYDVFCRPDEFEKHQTQRKVSVVPKLTETLRPDQFYTTPRGTYHSADTNCFAVTIAVFSDWVDEPCRVVSDTPKFNSASRKKQVVAPNVVRPYLTKVNLL
jgi:hypothetical protein